MIENDLDKINEVINFYHNISLEEEFLKYHLHNFEKRIIFITDIKLEKEVLKNIK